MMGIDGLSQQSTFGFGFSDSSCLRSGSLFAYQILMRYLSPWQDITTSGFWIFMATIFRSGYRYNFT